MFYLLSWITSKIFSGAGPQGQPGESDSPNPGRSDSQNPGQKSGQASGAGKPLTGNLDQNLDLMRQALGESQDIEFRMMTLDDGSDQGLRCALIYVRTVVDLKVLNQSLISPLSKAKPEVIQSTGTKDLPRALAERAAAIGDVTVENLSGRAAQKILSGWTGFLIEGSDSCALAGTDGIPKRTVDVPQTEFSIRGPLDAFTEDLSMNIGLIRRRIKDPSLTVHLYEVGRRGKNRVAMLYIEGKARPEVIRQIEDGLNSIWLDAVFDVGQLAELVSGRRISPFPLLHRTERPDKLSGDLLGGKVVLLLDGSPAGVSAPAVLNEFFLGPDDYYVPPISAFFLRLARIFGWAAVMFLPAVYVAVSAYNPGMIRSELAMIIAATRDGVPFSALMEVLFLETMIEMLEAAAVRLPTRLGSTATVVGGLIIGQVAAQAQIISITVLVISAITFISSYTFPSYEITVAWRISKWIVFWSAALFGVYGLFIGVFILLAYLNSFESFGVPYLRPFAPFVWRDFFSDTLFRAPWWAPWRARAADKQDR